MELNLNPMIDQMVSIYKWEYKYAHNVASEYHRFLTLRNHNNKLSPSDTIDKFWHQHILNTDHYLGYCRIYFNNIIHHNPANSFDQKSKSERLTNTITAYKTKYKSFINDRVWLGLHEDISHHDEINMIEPVEINK